MSAPAISRSILKSAVVLTAAATLLAFPSGARAEIISFSATLTGGQEVPPVDTKALGLAGLDYNTSTKTFDLGIFVVGLTLGELRDNPGRFHVHAAPVRVSGDVIVPLGQLAPFQSVPGGLFFSATNIALTNPAVNEPKLLRADTYLNLHTNAHTSGEIRGQLVPEPSALTLAGVATVLGLVGYGRRRKQTA